MSNTLANSLSWVDYIIIVIILISTLTSLMRGFIAEAISLLIWIVAVIVAFKFTTPFSYWLIDLIKSSSLRLIVSFLILFLSVLIVGGIANHFLAVLISKTGLSGTNRILGMIFGFARGILLIAIFILFAQFTSITKESWWSSSYLIPHFEDVTNWLKGFIPAQVNNLSHFMSKNSSNSGGTP